MQETSEEVGRPSIPAEIKRRVLVEAGHRCAIPTCRHIQVELHHITPWATCRTHEYENLIALCPNCHHRADRGEIDRKSLFLYKFNLRAAHDKFSQLEMDMLLQLVNAERGVGYPWMPYLSIFFARSMESGFLETHRSPMSTSMGGIDTTPIFVVITEAGRKFVSDLGLQEM